ncbi:hypothetical protein N9L30_04120 [Burkholderiaceae bacterium]|nr:hypothetical protein [Burkholderiaceae bacterium]
MFLLYYADGGLGETLGAAQGGGLSGNNLQEGLRYLGLQRL